MIMAIIVNYLFTQYVLIQKGAFITFCFQYYVVLTSQERMFTMEIKKSKPADHHAFSQNYISP